MRYFDFKFRSFSLSEYNGLINAKVAIFSLGVVWP